MAPGLLDTSSWKFCRRSYSIGGEIADITMSPHRVIEQFDVVKDIRVMVLKIRKKPNRGQRSDRPRAGGSKPSTATNEFNDLGNPYPLLLPYDSGFSHGWD